jgi:hypothetical protein
VLGHPVKSALAFCQMAASANRRFQFHKRSQLFIRVHNGQIKANPIGVLNLHRPAPSISKSNQFQRLSLNSFQRFGFLPTGNNSKQDCI